MERYFLNGLAESNRKAYGSSKKRYMAFYMSKGLKPLPAKEHQICQFVCHLADSKLCHNTIKCYLSAIRHLHISEGPKISSMACLEQVLKGIKSHQAKAADPKKTTRLPITPELLLLRMKQSWERAGATWDNSMLWHAMFLRVFTVQRDNSSHRV